MKPTSIQRIEAAIVLDQYPEPVLKYRVYTLTTSPLHIKAGADFMLDSSFDALIQAEAQAETLMDSGLCVAVVVY